MSTEARLATTSRELPLLLRIPHAARELSCSVSTIYQLVDTGVLDLVRLGPKSSRITSESILRALGQSGEYGRVRDTAGRFTPGTKPEQGKS